MHTIAEIEKRKAEIVEESKKATGDALDKLTKEMECLNQELAELRKEQDNTEKRKKLAELINAGGVPTNPIEKRDGGIPKHGGLDSIEYRQAFMEYVRTGTMPVEFRDVAMTSDNGAVIPATTLNEIVEKLNNYGRILPRVHRIAYPSGLVVPNSIVGLTAEWQTENAAANVQNKTTGQITFTAYQLRASAGVSFQMDVRSLSAFESTLIKNVTDAMGMALEQAIIAGTGVGQPTGITKATPTATVTLSATPTYKDLVSIIKAIPSAYKAGSVLVMNEGTAITLTTITDSNGQPVAHVNYGVDSQPVYRVLGKEIVTTDYLPDIDAAKAGDEVAFAVDLGKYYLNTSYDMDLRQYIDDQTRAKVYDSVMLVDGKLVDNNGLVAINKAAAAK